MNPLPLPKIPRRDFLAAGAALAAGAVIPAAVAADAQPVGLIDTNVSLGRWPFRRLPLDETPALVAKLHEHGVTQAWAGSFDALFHKDLSAVNARLADECAARGGGILIPFGAVNPAQPGWEEDLRRCAEVHSMRGIRLHPNDHGYKLDDPAFSRVLEAAAARGLVVQIAVIMEEERTIHPLVAVPPVDTAPLAALLGKIPEARVQLLNAFRTLRGRPVAELATAGAHFEIATLEGVEGVAKLLVEIPPGRLHFGSHAPFFYFESAKLKLEESALDPGKIAALATASSGLLRVR